MTEQMGELRALVGDAAFAEVVRRFGGERLYIRKRAGNNVRDRDIRRQFDHLLYADVPSAQAIAMLCVRYGLSERSLRRILKG